MHFVTASMAALTILKNEDAFKIIYTYQFVYLFCIHGIFPFQTSCIGDLIFMSLDYLRFYKTSTKKRKK